jgi:hypothetical protein
MKLNTRPGNRPVFRKRRATAPAAQVIVIPAQIDATELAEAYTWSVNAAVENNRTELAYELARSFAREA